jgi:hypothetical protein
MSKFNFLRRQSLARDPDPHKFVSLDPDPQRGKPLDLDLDLY